jgi:hypothetical protein
MKNDLDNARKNQQVDQENCQNPLHIKPSNLKTVTKSPNQNFFSAIQNQYSNKLRDAPPELKADKNFVRQIIKKDGWALRYAAKELLEDRQLVLEATANFAHVLCITPKHFRADPEIVITALQNDAWALYWVHPSLKNDRKIIFTAVKTNGNILFSLPKKFLADREIVMEAVTQNGLNLQYASPELQADYCIINAAVEQTCAAIKFVDQFLYNDMQFIMSLYDKKPGVLQHLPLNMQKEIVYDFVIKNKFDIINHLSPICITTYHQDLMRFNTAVFFHLPRQHQEQKESLQQLFSSYHNCYYLRPVKMHLAQYHKIYQHNPEELEITDMVNTLVEIIGSAQQQSLTSHKCTIC